MNPSIILDTDIGYDPDDLFALLFLHRLAGERLRLLVTADEIDGKRALFAQHILSLLGNTHTSVVAGSSLGLDNFIIDSLLPVKQKTFHTDFIAAMKRVIDTSESIVYIGIGGFTNLARFIDAHPADARRMKIFLMGGAINYSRKSGWVEHNVRIDPASAKKVLASGCDLSYVMAQTTHNPDYEVHPTHPLFTSFAESSRKEQKLLHEHCRIWFEQKKHGTMMHDPLTVAAALGYSYVDFHSDRVSMDEKGMMRLDEAGFPMRWSDKTSRSAEFMTFLTQTLAKKSPD